MRDEKNPDDPTKDGKKVPWAYEVVKEDEKGEGPNPTIVTEPRGIYPKRDESSGGEKPRKTPSYFTQGYTQDAPKRGLLPLPNTKEGYELDKRLIADYVKGLEASKSKVLGVTWRTADAERVEREIGIPALSVHRSLTNLDKESSPSALDVIRAQWRYATWQISARERDKVVRERERTTRYDLDKGTTVLFIGERSNSLEFKDFLKESKRYGARVLFTEDLLPKLRVEEERRRHDEHVRQHSEVQNRHLRLEGSETAPTLDANVPAKAHQTHEKVRELGRER